MTITHRQPVRSAAGAFVAGGAVGLLGGMIGLGGAEFRLPLLIGVFGFVALDAVIINKAMSLVVVSTALPARLASIPFDDLRPHWNIVINLLAGSLVAAWLGASAATRMRTLTLYRVLAVLLVLIAAVLVGTHLGTIRELGLNGSQQVVAGVLTGLLIGLAVGSIVGTIIGGRLVGAVSESVLIPALGAILIASALKVWRHQTTESN